MLVYQRVPALIRSDWYVSGGGIGMAPLERRCSGRISFGKCYSLDWGRSPFEGIESMQCDMQKMKFGNRFSRFNKGSNYMNMMSICCPRLNLCPWNHCPTVFCNFVGRCPNKSGNSPVGVPGRMGLYKLLKQRPNLDRQLFSLKISMTPAQHVDTQKSRLLHFWVWDLLDVCLLNALLVSRKSRSVTC